MSKHSRSHRWLATLRLLLLLLISFGMLIAFYATFFLAPTNRLWTRRTYRWTRGWGRAMAWACGIAVEYTGPLPPKGSLIAPNHVSYGDIPAILTAIRTYFIGKSELASWPVIGMLFRHSRQIIVTRQNPRGLRKTIATASERIDAGMRVCVFLEGTSSAGEEVLPFKAPLTEIALKTGCPVVPVAVNWQPADESIDVAEEIAFWKDHQFGAHSWRFLGLRGKRVKIAFGEPIQFEEGTSRKECAARLHAAVSSLLNDLKRN